MGKLHSHGLISRLVIAGFFLFGLLPGRNAELNLFTDAWIEFTAKQSTHGYDQMGYSVAINQAADTAVVGVIGHDYPSVNDAGAVSLMFAEQPSNWDTLVTLAELFPESSSKAGFSVAVNSDGSVIAVGAPYRNMLGTDRGCVLVYTRPAGGWSSPAYPVYLAASDGADNDTLGWSVAIDGSGNTIAAGATSWEGGVDPNRGAVYVFTKTGATWSSYSQAIISLNVANPSKQLGYSVGLSEDGNFLAAGAPFDSSAMIDTNIGAAYIFRKPVSGWVDTTSFIAKLTASDANYDYYLGRALAFSADGSTLAAGSNKGASGSNRGGVYIFEENSLFGWQTGNEIRKMTANDSIDGDFLGWSLALNADGSRLIAGAPFNPGGMDHIQAGAAYVFDRSVFGWGVTTNYSAKLAFSYTVDYNHMGFSVSTNKDGRYALVGIPDLDVGSSPSEWDSGAFVIFLNPTKVYLPIIRK